jgi:hypothetical protein
MIIGRQRIITRVFVAQGLSLVLLFILTGCGGPLPFSSPSPVAVSISPSTASLLTAETKQFTAIVANANDTSVTWTVDGIGTVSSAGLYTAPSVIPSMTWVNVRATSRADSTKFDIARVYLTPLTVAIPEDSVILGARESHQFTATVARCSNTAVTWSLSGCTGAACGTISSSGLYTGPESVPGDATVTVKATSKADPTKSDTATIYHRPIAVSIRPTWGVIPLGKVLSFSADVRYDFQNAGVTWSLSPECTAATCGTLTNAAPTSVTYTAPAAAPVSFPVMLYAKSVADANKTASASISISLNTLLKEGDYAFYFFGTEGDWQPPYSSPALPIVVAGRFHADGRGNITDGLEDMNLGSGVSQSVAFTGAYAIGADHRGRFTMTTAKGTSTYLMTVEPPGTKGKFMKFDALPENSPISGTGYFEMQDKAAFSLSSIAGPYAIGISSLAYGPLAALGRFTVGTTGEFSDGRMDTNGPANPIVTGSLGTPSSSTGRGIATLTLTPAPPFGATFNFAYYVISAQKILLIQMDDRTSNVPVLSGEMRRQDGSFSMASLNAPVIFSTSGYYLGWWSEGPIAAIGRMNPDGSGLLSGVIDRNEVVLTDNPPVLNTIFSASYFIEPDGRSTIALRDSNKENYIAYFYGQNQGFLLRQTADDLAVLGELKPQIGDGFSADDISETFLTNTIPGLSVLGYYCAEKSFGLTIFDAGGTVTSTLDACGCSNLSHFEFAGAYTVAANGRGTVAFDKPTKRALVFWIVSPTELVAISTVNPDDYSPVLVEYRR